MIVLLTNESITIHTQRTPIIQHEFPEAEAIDFLASPNPFNPSTTIEFSIPNYAEVTLTVFDITGRKIVTLVDGNMTTGNHSVVFDGTGLSSGVYFYRLSSDEIIKNGKMLLMK